MKKLFEKNFDPSQETLEEYLRRTSLTKPQ